MKNKEKIVIGILIGIIILIVIISGMIYINLNKSIKEVERENEKLKTLEVKTKSNQEIMTLYTRIDNEKFFIKIPTNFKQLDADTISQKYYGDVPQTVFSNEDDTINILINMTTDEMSNDDIKSYHDEMLKLLGDNSRIIYSDYYEVDNHNIGKIKYLSNAVDTKIYNNTIFFSYNNKLVLISFNCTKDLQEEWEVVSDFIVDSLFLTDLK